MPASELIEHYRRDGFLFPLTAMSTEEAAGYRRRLSAFEAANPTDQPIREAIKAKAHLVCLALLEIVWTCPSLVESHCLCFRVGLEPARAYIPQC